MTDKTYDLIVIGTGTGTAASVTAFNCRKAGWSVAVIDHRPFGGTCALRGCDPKKMLIAATEVINLFGFAIRSDLTADTLRYATFAYPTAASDIESMLP